MPTQCPAEMFENLAQFIATAPVEIQAAFELNERVYAATLEGVLKEKRRNVELQKQLEKITASNAQFLADVEFLLSEFGNMGADFDQPYIQRVKAHLSEYLK